MSAGRSLGLSEQIEREAERRPDAVAISGIGAAVTYSALIARSSALAARLRTRSMNRPVGILDDRGAERIIAMLACMKAACPFVPLDPALPEADLRGIKQHSGLDVIISAGAATRLLPPDLRALVMEPGALTQEEAANAPAPDDAAPLYILYTSGSTGRSKGVAMPHGPLRNLVGWQSAALPLQAGAKVLQFAPLGFDVAAQEILTTLVAGGELVLVDEETRRQPFHLLRLIESRGIERVFLPVHALRLIAAEGLPCPAGLKDIIAAGEPLILTPAIARFVRSGRCRLHNHYGPTETHVVTAFTLRGNPEGWPVRVPIGSAIEGVRIDLRRDDLSAVREGEPGEICIFGSALADGYHADPDLTAKRFMRDPLTGEKMFRTGDIARHGPHGLEFAGRRDRQVKLRGVRLDLEAVETALAQDEDVNAAAVTLTPGPEGGLHIAIVPTPAARQRAMRAARRVRLAQEKAIWDRLYEEEAGCGDPYVDRRGWIDSTRRRDFSGAEIRDWADATASRIRSLSPKSILEIGCGSGMLITRLLGHVNSYTGTDISAAALDQARRACARLGLAGERLSLFCQPAHRPLQQAEGAFDCVVLNSVIELFPDVDYLRAVLHMAARQTAPGGSIFVGDIRHGALLGLFHETMKRDAFGREPSLDALLREAGEAAARERRLFVDPAFFLSIGHGIPRIRTVSLSLRRDRLITEMSRYRYDAVLHLDQVPAAAGAVKHYRWPACPPFEALVEYCREGSVVHVSGLPNERLASENAFSESLRSGPASEGGNTIPKEDAAPAGNVEPEDLWALESQGLSVGLSFTPFCPRGSLSLWLSAGQSPAEPATTLRPSPAYTNEPSRAEASALLHRHIVTRLQERLPDVAIGAALIVLDDMPLTRSGKVDRRAIARQAARRRVPMPARPVPGETIDAAVMQCWRDVLGEEDIDADKGFFDHGGTSQLLVALLEALNESLPGPVSFAELLRHPTVRQLSEHLSRAGAGAEREKGARVA